MKIKEGEYSIYLKRKNKKRTIVQDEIFDELEYEDNYVIMEKQS